MSHVEQLTFNPFQENTFVVYDNTRECVIIDPGCYEEYERTSLKQYIESNGLQPVRLLNTHCHVDHVLGNAFVAREYGLELEIHQEGEKTLEDVQKYVHIYGLGGYEVSPEPKSFFQDEDKITFGESEFEVRYAPGHCPGHVVFVNHKDQYVINGDVLFSGSIGRTDLPGGDFGTLEKSIRDKMYTLPDEYTIYCGHGPTTTVGDEKSGNPFVRPQS